MDCKYVLSNCNLPKKQNSLTVGNKNLENGILKTEFMFKFIAINSNNLKINKKISSMNSLREFYNRQNITILYK